MTQFINNAQDSEPTPDTIISTLATQVDPKSSAAARYKPKSTYILLSRRSRSVLLHVPK